ncbi:hypothetical protein SEA_SIXAMA_167 [Gordonia phage Sixama]|uniref:Uncharacterized protein n=1 Tax=Gordonia phage Sixama TaxID=2653271 RepID=A0A5Q2F4A2_9CAUD|nr:hypothetical protein PP302_gp162 [Gordonia phage Sixama]QGF20317.1 hypothetical protein SEA_SIXAMA_167 [Gordonia phage Sixama]
MAAQLPIGVSRGRHVELTTKAGNTVAGAYVREKDGTVYLKFTASEGKEAVVSTDLEGIDVFIVGPKVDEADTDD